MIFSVGDKVYWTSQSSGFAKRKEGIIVAVVPPGADPKSCIPQKSDGRWFQLKRPGMSRNHESYLIRVGKQINLYWPVVKNLHMDIRNVKQKFCPTCGNKLQEEEGDCDFCVALVKGK